MATGPDTLELILECAADWANTHAKDPTRILLPVRMAWDLAKCGPGDLGKLSGKVMKKGIVVFEEAGLLGLEVKIIRERDALLRME